MTESVSKKDLVSVMADEAGITKVQAAAALDAFTGKVAASCKKDIRVSIAGFGAFNLAKRAARTGRNPKTGESLKIKASKSVSFKAGKNLKESL